MSPYSLSIASCFVVLGIAASLPATASAQGPGSGAAKALQNMPVAPPPPPPPRGTVAPPPWKDPPPIPKRPPPVDGPAHGPNPLGASR